MTARKDKQVKFLALILLEALEDGNEAGVNSILENNTLVDPSCVPHDRGISPLHYVCGMDNERWAAEITKRFLEIGADPNVKGEDNMTPLHVAALYGRVEIVSLLLKHGGSLDVFDDERKTPMHYAIEECHFEVIEVMRNYVFSNKYEQKQKKIQNYETPKEFHLSKEKIDQSIRKRTSKQLISTPNKEKSPNGRKTPINKNLSKVDDNAVTGVDKYTPNRLHYNFDVTSPYFIHITHRRHHPQPKFPPMDSEERKENESSSLQKINIFALTKDNIEDLSRTLGAAERSRKSIIETWREKVQRSQARKSILKEFDDINEMIDDVMENDHLNYTNVKLKDKAETTDANGESCRSHSHLSGNCTEWTSMKHLSLGAVIQAVAQAPLLDIAGQQPSAPADLANADSSYQTAPEIEASKTVTLQVPQRVGEADSSRVVPSPKNLEFFTQMTEEYLHKDDEVGLVFYETKFLSNNEDKATLQRNPEKCLGGCPKADISATTESTDITIPVDYETDELRAELNRFGDPPGPITKSTKRLYLKRLIKYKRQIHINQELKRKLDSNKAAFSVELLRTLQSLEMFKNIAAYVPFEKISLEYFSSHKNKREMREGHLKQSFIYMLIDPRISGNLPGERVFMNNFDMWKRFLESIFYVGKGKTSRPYSHLYEAMKAHMRLNGISTQMSKHKEDKKISIKKHELNMDLFKSPPIASSNSKKLDRILEIWGSGQGVVCLHVFHNITPAEAYTREAAMIDALSLKHLTNVKRGDYYGPAKTWSMKQKKYLGIALLYRAMQIHLAEGESQLSPCDLI